MPARQEWGTFKEYADGWLKEREADGVVMACDEENNLRRYVYPTIGAKPLKDGEIKPADIKEVLAWRRPPSCHARPSGKIRPSCPAF